MNINKSKFYEGYRLVIGRITDEQLIDLEFFIDKLNASEKISGTDWDIVREKYAYVFATVYWETSQTFDPISEYGSRRYLMNKSYYPYYGRGYVQLTWKANYIKFGKFLGIDLVNNPHFANEPENAWLILEEGMTRNTEVKRIDDPNFTAYTLDDVFNDDMKNLSQNDRFLKARRIINRTDKAQSIATLARKFYNIIEFI